jgi:hypothetical protein
MTTVEQMTQGMPSKMAILFTTIYKKMVDKFIQNGFTAEQSNRIAFFELVSNGGFEQILLKAI